LKKEDVVRLIFNFDHHQIRENIWFGKFT